MNPRSETLPGTNLNSVWLEATVSRRPRGADAGPAGALRFRVRSADAPGPAEGSEFEVEATEAALGLSRERLRAGRRLRIIGRLTGGQRGVRIVSDWVEPVSPLT